VENNIGDIIVEKVDFELNDAKIIEIIKIKTAINSIFLADFIGILPDTNGL
jgi:hypothetical protein